MNVCGCDTVGFVERKPTTIRLSEDERELIDAWAGHISAQTGTIGTTSAVIRLLLKRAKPPESAGETQSRIRRAYTTIFGKEPT